MSDAKSIQALGDTGDRKSADDLLPLVYDELRKLASVLMKAESPGQTLNGTALVHEAYLRLRSDQRFDHQGHFFAAAAQAMRRILADRARGKGSLKRGNKRRRVELFDIPSLADTDPDLLLSLDEAISKLAASDGPAAAVAELHLFAGLSIEEASTALGVSRATAYRNWTYARAFLQLEIGENS